MSDLYIKERLQAIKGIASASCADIKDADNISSFCDEIYSVITKLDNVVEELKETKSSDYIRREDVLKLVNQFVFGVTEEQVHEAKKTFIKYVEKIPTAYSIEKVIEELEEVAYVDEDVNNFIDLEDATEIVKQGDVSDDVCEWRENGLFLYTSCGDRVNAYSDDFKYCPYCSKQIKMGVE